MPLSLGINATLNTGLGLDGVGAFSPFASNGRALAFRIACECVNHFILWAAGCHIHLVSQDRLNAVAQHLPRRVFVAGHVFQNDKRGAEPFLARYDFSRFGEGFGVAISRRVLTDLREQDDRDFDVEAERC